MRYGKFIEARGSAAFKLRFLARAVESSDCETREHLQYIYAEPPEEDGRLWAAGTDGRHLHAVEFTANEIEFLGITPGYWKVLKKGFKHDEDRIWIARLDDCETGAWIYPAWRKVIPEGDIEYRTCFDGFTFNTGPGANHHGLATFLHDFPSVTAINLEQLQALGNEQCWEVEWRDPCKVIKFTSGNCMALIMPL